MDLLEILSKLLEKYSANNDEVIGALQQHAQGLYQRVFDRGHSVGLTKGREEKTAVETELARTKTELETANTSLTDLRAKTPDVANVTAQFQGEINRLKTDHANQLNAERERYRTAEQNRHLATVQAKLTGKLNPLYVKLLTQDAELKKRIAPKDDGKLEVLQAGKDIPFSPAEGQDVLDLLVEELITAAPADYRLVDGDQGSGVQNTPGTTVPSNNLFDRIRKDRKTEQEKAAKLNEGIKSLDEKLGVRSA